MKIWKLVLGFLGLVGGLFAAGATKNKNASIINNVPVLLETNNAISSDGIFPNNQFL